jgi:hypothetical protein
MVIGPEPAVKGCGAFLAVVVDRAVGPAREHGADESLSLAVGLGPVGPGAEVANAQAAAGDRVHGGAVGGAVVGHQLLDRDPVAAIERGGAAQKADHGGASFVSEDFGVGEAGAVVAGDMHAFPADLAPASAGPVGLGRVAAPAPVDAMPGAALDAPELLDVDVNELAWALALVALGGLQPEPAEPAHPDPGQNARDRRAGHVQDLGDLGAAETQPPQRRDRLDPPLVGAIGDQTRRRAAIHQPQITLDAIARDPLRARPRAHLSGRGGLCHRPALLEHPNNHPLPLSQ